MVVGYQKWWLRLLDLGFQQPNIVPSTIVIQIFKTEASHIPMFDPRLLSVGKRENGNVTWYSLIKKPFHSDA